MTHVVLHEWEERRPDPGTELAGLSLGDGEAAAQAAALTAANILNVMELRQGLHLRATSYVGRVRLGGVTITVRPKVPQLPLTRLLRYAYGLRKLRLMGQAEQSQADDPFPDLLIAQLVAEVEELLARGLHRRYVQTEETLAVPRGRIDFQRLAPVRR